MTTQTTTETDASDNGTEPTETEGGAGTENNGTEPTETEGGAEPGSEPNEEEDGRLKALRRKLDEQAEELGRLRKAEEDRSRAEMSEAERLKADLAAREAELEELRTTALRSAIATEYGLSAELAERLRGSTEEDLKADAAELAKLVKRPPAAPAGAAGIGGKADTPPADPLELHRSWVGK